MVVEDDIRFAKIMIEKAHELRPQGRCRNRLSATCSTLNKYNPIAVTLDVKLPDASGWRILDLFKNDINFRHIPVHLISGEENRLLAMQRGARSFNLKPLKNEALTVELFKTLSYTMSTSRKLCCW
jgi:DNA-binding response OmpR family regulator